MQDYFSNPRSSGKKAAHYYGDTVRRLFIVGGILILVSMPFYNNIVPISPTLVTLAVIVLVLAAAITTRVKKWIIVVDSVLSAIFLIAFETYSVVYYLETGKVAFIIRQAVAIIFLFALYYSVKTLRAMYLNQITKQT